MFKLLASDGMLVKRPLLVTDSPMDEVLKDADVIHHCMNDLSKAIKGKEQARYDKLCEEFGM